jgi:signal peptidase I
MSDEHKPHDETHGHDHPAEVPATPEAAPEAVAEAEVASGVEPHVEPSVEAVHDEVAHDPAVHADAAEEAVIAHADHHDEPAPESSPAATDPEPFVETVVAETPVEPAEAGKRPVWSDEGDAPFEDIDATPVYAGRKKRKKKGGNETIEILKTVFFALLIALVLRTVAFQPFTIPSASMEPNLYEGDYIVVSKWSYGYSRHSILGSPPLFKGRILASAPHRGDIVVFKLPRDNKTDYIKRLIGLPGDRIQMINNVLYINGQPSRDVVLTREQATSFYGQTITQLRETFPDGSKTFTIQDFGPGNTVDDTPVFEVPQGYYFMMGDNRDNSLDSRFDQSTGVGLVPAENLIGKAEIILFSWSPGASLWNPVSWFSKVRPSRFFTVLH